MLKALIQKRDFYAGGVMLLLGAGAIAGVRGSQYGNLMHMGPGFFPTALGVILIGLGILIAGTSISAPVTAEDRILPERPEWFGWFCIVAGPLLFILFGEYGGMAPAIFACVFVAARGDKDATLLSSFLLALGMTLFGTLLFSYLLHVPFPIFRSELL